MNDIPHHEDHQPQSFFMTYLGPQVFCNGPRLHLWPQLSNHCRISTCEDSQHQDLDLANVAGGREVL